MLPVQRLLAHALWLSSAAFAECAVFRGLQRPAALGAES